MSIEPNPLYLINTIMKLIMITTKKEYTPKKFYDVRNYLLLDLKRFFKFDYSLFHPFNKLYLIICIVKFFFTNKGFRAIFFYRMANYAHIKQKNLILYFILFFNLILNEIEISHEATIGPGFKIPHAQCIVIGNAVIGKNVTIYNGVTIGATWGKEIQGAKYANIGSNCIVSSGAKIIGPITIGENTIIGANAVVVNDIEPNSIVVGIPGKIISSNTKKIEN